MDRSRPCQGVSRVPVFIPLIFFVICRWLVGGPADADDGLVLYPTEAEAIFRLDRTDLENRSDSSLSSRETEWEAGVRIKQEGHFVDRDFTRFLFDIEPLYSDNKFESDSFNENTTGKDFNYLLLFGFLKGTPGPVSLDVQALRTSNTLDGSLGSRYENVVEGNQAILRTKSVAFPISLRYKEERLEQDFISSVNNSGTQRDDFSKSWALQGRSSKLDVRLEHKTLDDLVIATDNDYDLDQANVSHRLTWGRDSELWSRIDYFNRTGYLANERLTLDENARIRHTENTFSRLNYRYYSVVQNVETDNEFIKYEFNHEIYKNLTNNFNLNSNSLRSDNEKEDVLGAGIESRYRKQKFFGGSVNAGVGLDYWRTDRVSSGGLIDVIGESYVVPLNGALTLTYRLIVLSSIVVTNFDGSVVYIDGLDYTVNTLADNFTEILIIPGGQINTGDTIQVSYQYATSPSQEFSTTQTRYNLGFDLNWMRVSHSDRRSEDSPIAGADTSFLNDTRFTLTDLEFRWELFSAEMLFAAERRFSKTGGTQSTTYTYQQRFSWKDNRKINWNLSLVESFTEQDIRDSELYSLDLWADWRPLGNMTVRPSLGVWKREDIGDQFDSTDEFVTAGLSLNWNYRKLVVNFSYFHNKRDLIRENSVSDTKTDEDRIMFKLTRKFL